ncbi:conserved hypothetical protein [Microsporum canis CBS 113480]|uniref:Protein kinase domain-containing protein n=1 Tax=Arthroderma otae (strain ATCC MYA-4605 / CBS 113480) TaxID=554155 RepID=C5FPK4_ARTOC|nr:conserved hypothetical protein [Microsporum canis CBS 113480]EEQ31520.1 conserved hypothetical protein [Microsporum canis CBS 113480]
MPQYSIGPADDSRPFWTQEYSDDACESIREYSETKEYFALKILKLSCNITYNVEQKILKKTGRLERSFLYLHMPTKRVHLCLVTKPAGCTLRARTLAGLTTPGVFGRPWDIISIRVFIETLLSKVFEFHDKGIYHGDLSPSNITLGLDTNAFAPEAIKESFEEDIRGWVYLARLPPSETHPVRPPCLPEYIIQHYFPLASNGWDFSLIEIIDFGLGGYETKKKKLGGTRGYRPPEWRDPGALGSIKCDLWSLGCVLYFGLVHDDLFETEHDQNVYVAATETDQLSIIDRRLEQEHQVFREHTEYRKTTSRLIHSLMKVDPTKRDAAKAREFLNELAMYADTVLQN